MFYTNHIAEPSSHVSDVRQYFAYTGAIAPVWNLYSFYVFGHHLALAMPCHVIYAQRHFYLYVFEDECLLQIVQKIVVIFWTLIYFPSYSFILLCEIQGVIIAHINQPDYYILR